jgi:hypothetical protein
MGIRNRKENYDPVPDPADQVSVEVRVVGQHILDVLLDKIDISGSGGDRSDYGKRVYYGIMPAGGAGVEAATSNKRELRAPPKTGEDLPHSVFTRKQRYRFDFSEDDRGKTVYFCAHYENAKGDVGPWGPIVSTIIP